MRYGGDGMRCDGRGLDGWSDDLGADDAAHPQSGRVKTGRRKPPPGRRWDAPHEPVCVMTIMRITTGINKAADAGRMDAQIRSTDALRRVSQTTATSSRISWLGPSGGNREPAALIVVWQMCYPVQPPAHPIQLADVAPPEAVQERPQGGWRLDRAAQGPGSVPRCATRRRRQCSRPQPARRPPGSASCLPCSPAPAHLRGQRGCRRVHADLN